MRTLPIAFCAATLLTAGLAMTTGACGDSEHTAGPADVYTARGIVKGITGNQVSIQHEAIPAFKDRDGNVAEMMSMTMGFALPDNLDRTNLTEGTKISMTFDVVWTRRPALQLVKFKVLPEDTALKL